MKSELKFLLAVRHRVKYVLENRTHMCRKLHAIRRKRLKTADMPMDKSRIYSIPYVPANSRYPGPEDQALVSPQNGVSAL